MPKLNQIIAVEKGVKSRLLPGADRRAPRAAEARAAGRHLADATSPKDEEGEQLPPESTRVQVKAEECCATSPATLDPALRRDRDQGLGQLRRPARTSSWTATSLLATCRCRYLLFLEKQLTDLHTFVKKLPVLDAAESWALRPSADCWATEPVRTLRPRRCRATTSRPRRPRSTRRRSRCTTRTSPSVTGRR